MSVKKDASGRRSVQVEVEVPGTPEEVWQAIATGEGVSSWFVPTESEGRVGGTVTSHFGPGMDSVAKVTAWDPPRRFAAESDGFGPNAPPLATEWSVEARSGGTCLVRVVHSLFASTDDWDDQLESIESGWPAFFRILHLYLTRFRGQRCAIFQVAAMAPQPAPEAWAGLTAALGLTGAGAGHAWKTGAGAPPLAGAVEAAGGRHPFLLVRFDAPAPGVASLNACPMGAQTYLQITFYLYGEGAAAAAAREEPAWGAWMQSRFPA
jgi:uncharacterized protein YndB with AHSA1/START domain